MRSARKPARYRIEQLVTCQLFPYSRFGKRATEAHPSSMKRILALLSLRLLLASPVDEDLYSDTKPTKSVSAAEKRMWQHSEMGKPFGVENTKTSEWDLMNLPEGTIVGLFSTDAACQQQKKEHESSKHADCGTESTQAEIPKRNYLSFYCKGIHTCGYEDDNFGEKYTMYCPNMTVPDLVPQYDGDTKGECIDAFRMHQRRGGGIVRDTYPEQEHRPHGSSGRVRPSDGGGWSECRDYPGRGPRGQGRDSSFGGMVDRALGSGLGFLDDLASSFGEPSRRHH